MNDETAHESVAAASATVAARIRYIGAIADWLADRSFPGPEARRYVADTFASLAVSSVRAKWILRGWLGRTRRLAD